MKIYLRFLNTKRKKKSLITMLQSFCFSQISDCKQLVCDWQGVWNELDGFTLTDPVIHSLNLSTSKENGATDKGQKGVESFFETHECSRRCKMMKLSLVVGIS